MQTSKLLTPSEVADLLGVSVQTLAVWRCAERYALPYVKVGARVRYRAEDLKRFIGHYREAGAPPAAEKERS